MYNLSEHSNKQTNKRTKNNKTSIFSKAVRFDVILDIEWKFSYTEYTGLQETV